MRNSVISASDFFVAGGTLRYDSPSYVERPADDELYNLTLAGEFCYVLTARQMGKSSLMIHTARRLQAEGINSVIIDLTKIGTDVNVEQWYLGLLTQLKRNLRLVVDLEAWWAEHTALGYVQRFTDFLDDILLREIQGQIVVFVDEIDTTLNVAFSDDFFAALRFVYNARATNPAYQRLTFVLLGVATPADLIKDRRRTPFNIGQEIDLNDFNRDDTQVLEQGLKEAYPEQGEAVFDRIFHWTNGHPYLTQKLCLSVTETAIGPWTNERVDKMVEKLFLSKEARKETNLQFVQDSVENSPQRPRLLSLYRQIYTGKAIPEVERSLDQNRLKLFGLVRVEENILQVRNEIYRQVFNLDWIKENTPIDWSRRLIVILSLLIILLVGGIGFTVWQQGRQQQAQTLIDNFRNTTDPDIRITSLAGLFDLGSEDQANQLFFNDLTPEDRINLFETTNPTVVGTQLTTVVQRLYITLENNERDNRLLEAMARPLDSVEDDARARNLQSEIEQWILGRRFFEAGAYQQAVGIYTDEVIRRNDRNSGAYFDRGLAYTAMDDADSALADFEEVLKLDESRQNRIRQVVTGNPILNDAAIAQGDEFPAVIALVPPTGTPTATSTPTLTPTSTPTLTSAVPTSSSATSETAPEPIQTPTETPMKTPTITPIPTSTSTPVPTATPTPKPATVVYVQSNGPTHDLGIVSSSGDLLNPLLHPRAGAPAWSPDGTEVAFYGEQGISELGGIYAQGNGIWIIEVETGTPRLLFQADHISNINWSPDDTKLAFEVGPPGVTHRVVVVDTRDGEEISRFPGEQPAWRPNGQQLVIKSCAPECGLWLVGFDGSSGKLITRDSTDSYPTWSPNGDYLVFSSRFRDGDWEIYRIPTDGDLSPTNVEGNIVRLTNQPGTDTTPVFSSDGLEIYWRTDAFGGWQIRAMAVDGSNDRPVTDEIGPSDDWGLARPAVR